MITISKVVLNNIKKFKGIHEFSFSEKNIFTISGKNGSGKTTIIESLMICQMAFFVNSNKDLLEHTEIYNKATEKICSLLSGNYSSISLYMIESESNKEITFTVNIGFIAEDYITWSLEISNEDYNIFAKYWDLQNPSCLFFYIDSDKYFDEKSITYDSLKIKKNDDPDSFLLNYIVDYKNVERFAYQKLINDWILQRLVPPDVNYQLSFLIGRILFSYLLPQLRIQHFTGATGNQFSILAKNIEENSKEFDYRFLSAGEKSIFYLCILINYFSNIGLLIIDEPENHLHEDLLLRLADTLQQIINCNDYPQYIIEKNIYKKKTQKAEESKFDLDTKKVFKNYKLQKVIFTTHSKSLIYKNFEYGENYVIDSEFKLLNQTSAEEELRKLGISTIYEKLLFVEGKDDKKVAEKFLTDKDVTVIPLGCCDKVVQMYKDILLIKDKLSTIKICFLMDRDTKDGKIDELEQMDPDFFENHFVVLDRHELENYYLDQKLWEDTLEIDNPMELPLSIKKEDIPSLLFKAANETKISVYQKELSEKLRMQITNLTEHLDKATSITCDTKEHFDEYANSVIEKISLEQLKSEFENVYENTVEKYSNWDKELFKYCDGKIAYHIFISKLARDLQVMTSRIELYIDKLIMKDKDSKYEITKVFDKIRNKLS